jgi:ADP-heptose:LPS heptosyltransferase/predicted SAM-dependent methyltransferase
MVWKASDPQGDEQAKIKWDIVPYTRGKVLDVGCGPNKAFPHFIGVDNGHHTRFGYTIRPDIWSEADELWFAKSQAYDAVFSSHTLEHLEDYRKVLKEWWRVIKPEGYLVLYLPHKDFYPNIGKDGANPDHKHDFHPDDIIEAMKEVGGWDLVENEERNGGQEYSFFQVYRKLRSEKCLYSYKDPKPEKTAAVIRYGAFGDLMQASSVFAGLKQQGYHVTLYSSPPGSDVIKHDPNIDRIILQDKDQVPNANLGDFWGNIKKKYDKFINLSESVEGTLLTIPDRIAHSWPQDVRHKYLNRNYLEFQHELSGVAHIPRIKFYPTDEERQWAKRQRGRFGRFVLMWSLAGSSTHKAWPYVDNIVASMLLQYPDSHIVLVGGPEAVILEAGWEKEPRVVRTCGKWNIRHSLAFLYEADMVGGPETGLLNAAACMDLPKIVLLSHSSHENLTRDWKNVTPVAPQDVKCYPCHMMHYNWDHCWRDESKDCIQCDKNEIVEKARCCEKHTGGAMCQARITAQQVWDAMTPWIDKSYEKAA